MCHRRNKKHRLKHTSQYQPEGQKEQAVQKSLVARTETEDLRNPHQDSKERRQKEKHRPMMMDLCAQTSFKESLEG